MKIDIANRLIDCCLLLVFTTNFFCLLFTNWFYFLFLKKSFAYIYTLYLQSFLFLFSIFSIAFFFKFVFSFTICFNFKVFRNMLPAKHNKRKITSYFTDDQSDNKSKRSSQLKTDELLNVQFHNNCMKKILHEELFIDYGVVFDKRNADQIFQLLESQIVYNKLSQVKLFGKLIDVPRKQTAFGDEGLSYTFSGVTLFAQAWFPLMRKLKEVAEQLTLTSFNFVLVNRYDNGNEYIGFHQDNEKDLDAQAPIASFSFGQDRDFIFKYKRTAGSKPFENVTFHLTHGSLLIMHPPTNNLWYHSLPKRSVKTCPNPRINLTFRRMKLNILA